MPAYCVVLTRDLRVNATYYTIKIFINQGFSEKNIFFEFFILDCANNGILIGAFYVGGEGPIGGIWGDQSCATAIACYILGENATEEELSRKDFCLALGFGESIWDLDDLDLLNGKFPMLK